MKSQTVAASRPEPFWSGKVVRFMVDEWLAPLAFFLLALAVTSYELNATPDFEQTHIFVLVMLTLLSFLFLVNRVIRSLPRLKILLIEEQKHGVSSRVHGYAEDIGVIRWIARELPFWDEVVQKIARAVSSSRRSQYIAVEERASHGIIT